VTTPTTSPLPTPGGLAVQEKAGGPPVGRWLFSSLVYILHCDMTDICFRISPCDFLFILLTNHVPFMIVAADCQLMLKHVVMIVGVFTGL